MGRGVQWSVHGRGVYCMGGVPYFTFLIAILAGYQLVYNNMPRYKLGVSGKMLSIMVTTYLCTRCTGAVSPDVIWVMICTN